MRSLFFLDKARKGSWAVVFTCASGWNGCRRASCTMQNQLSITQPHFHLAKRHPIRKHYTHSFSTENRMTQSERTPHHSSPPASESACLAGCRYLASTTHRCRPSAGKRSHRRQNPCSQNLSHEKKREQGHLPTQHL